MASDRKAAGQRLLKAFAGKGITSKSAIAEALGYKSEQSIYKVAAGQQELGYDALIRFSESTGRSIDWLVTGKEPEQTTDVGAPSDKTLAFLTIQDFAQVLEQLAREVGEKAGQFAASDIDLLSAFHELPADRQEEVLMITREYADRVREQKGSAKREQPQAPAERKKRVA